MIDAPPLLPKIRWSADLYAEGATWTPAEAEEWIEILEEDISFFLGEFRNLARIRRILHRVAATPEFRAGHEKAARLMAYYNRAIKAKRACIQHIKKNTK